MARLPGEDRRPEETARSGTPPSPRQSEAQGFEQGFSPAGLWDALAVGGALRGELFPTRNVTRLRFPRRGSIRRFPLEQKAIAGRRAKAHRLTGRPDLTSTQ